MNKNPAPTHRLELPSGFVEEIRELRRQKRLHGRTMMALVAGVNALLPDWTCCSEVLQTPGGRNDAVLFERGGQSICFELFASASQVDRDLLLLVESPATKKIAILVDRDIDPDVANAYYRKRPVNPCPSIWLSEVLLTDRRGLLHLRLLEYVLGDRRAELVAIARQLQRTLFKRTVAAWKAQGLEIYNGEHNESPTFRSVLAALTVAELAHLGIPAAKCEGAVRVVNENFEFLIRQYLLGVPMYLIWDGDSFFVLDDVDYDAWLGGSVLQGEAHHVLVLLNRTYVRLREAYLGELPPPGDMGKMLGLIRGHFGNVVRNERPND